MNKKRSMKIWIEGNNYAAKRINGKWLDDFNKKEESKNVSG